MLYNHLTIYSISSQTRVRGSRHTNAPFARLLDTLHYDSKLYLVFEFLDNDLKRYQDAMNAAGTPLTMQLIKVRYPGWCTPVDISHPSVDLSEIHVAAVLWFGLLPLSTYLSPRLETAKLAYRP